MTSLKEFLDKNNKVEQKALVSNASKQIGMGVNNEFTIISSKSNSNEKAEKLSAHLVDVSTSNEVLTELSSKIGEPFANETKADFVKRAKSELTTILKRRLPKKI